MRAEANCASFAISLDVAFVPHGLAASEVEDVKRALKNGISQMVSKLPFAHVYPFEVKVR